jgi:hypothetical protein|tara:strand:- start:6909 stop:7436 length:528 start_codon:yes stop_codon:yes gene_type:complete
MKNNFIEKYKIPLEHCDDLLEYYRTHNEHKGFRKDINNTIDLLFFNESRHPIIIQFFKYLSECVVSYSRKYNITNSLKTQFQNKIQHYSTNVGFTNIHYERSYTDCRRQLVYMLYLNTIKDQGGTRFPLQNKVFKAIKGNLLIWPADFTHPHAGIVSPTEEKYIVTGWLNIERNG